MSETERFVQTMTTALEQRKVGTTIAVTRQASLRVDPDDLLDQLRVRLESYVMAEKLVGDTKDVSGSIPFPTSPWQFFKQRHSGSWWLRWLVTRRPVRVERHRWEASVTFERYANYPESTLRVPELGRPVIFEQFTQPWPW
jgi:hypothetical protein